MINSLEIQNFQSHKDSFIEFSKGLNIITGSSDAGKSAIIRALLWVITNRPSGDAYRNWDNPKEAVRVGIEFDDDWLVKERDGTKNSYETQSGKLEAFRTDIPEEVQNITKITDYNIQTQHQPYFLLQDSPGEVAKKLNELVGLDIIDTLYKNINSRITDTKTRIKFSEERISDLTSQVENLAYIDRISVLIKRLDLSISEKEIVENQLQYARGLYVSLIDLNSKIENQKKVVEFEEGVNLLKEKIRYQKELFEKSLTLSNLKLKVIQVEKGLLQELEWLAIEPKFTDLSEKTSKKKEIQKKGKILADWLSAYQLVNANLTIKKQLLKTKKEKYLTTLKEAKVCPTCRSPISDETLRRIIEEGLDYV